MRVFMMRKNILILLFLTLIVFIVNSKSLGLTLYADDWIIIAKYFAWFGEGKLFPVWRLDMWFVDYGFQNMTGVLYSIFGSSHWVYFVINLFFRSLAAYSIFFFSRKTISKNVGLLAGIFYASSAGGIEASDWVYNMPTYLGIFITMMGMTYFVTESGLKRLFLGWLLPMFGYSIGSLRLFVIPPLMIVLESTRTFLRQKRVTKTGLAKTVVSGFLVLVFILIYRRPFPNLGNFDTANFYIGEGISRGVGLISEGRLDFLLHPFTTIGFMIVPHGLRDLVEYGWKIYPLRNFVLFGSIFAFISSLFFLFSVVNKYTRIKLVGSFMVAVFVLSLLKVFVRYQGTWGLKELDVFLGTYFGLIFTLIVLVKIIQNFRLKNFKATVFYLVSFFASFSLLFPYVVNAGTIIFATTHRYMPFCFAGVSMVLGSILVFKSRDSIVVRFVKLFLIAFIIVLNIIVVDKFYSYQLTARTPVLEKELFSQIQSLVPDLPQDAPVIFYFEYPYHKTYYDLLYSSFGYHMQLLYKKPFEEVNIPTTVNSYEGLKKEMAWRKPPLDHIYALFWEDGKFVDRSGEIRKRLAKDPDLSVIIPNF